jgi:hypothetical protein
MADGLWQVGLWQQGRAGGLVMIGIGQGLRRLLLILGKA